MPRLLFTLINGEINCLVSEEINFYYPPCMQGVLYASVGFVCGLVGQGIANMIMTAKRYALVFAVMGSEI